VDFADEKRIPDRMQTREFGAAWAWGRSWPPRVIADRGACWPAPENSLRAIRSAVAAGADAIAIDIARCGTGEVVLCYERTLAKFGGGRWDDVATTPFATLQEIDLGGGERIPRLADALALIPDDRMIDVRLRSASRTDASRRELADLVMADVARAHAVPRVLVSSEEGAALAPFAATGTATALILPSMPAREFELTPNPPRVVRLELHRVGLNVMRYWHARNTVVHVWPANTRSQLGLAWSLGVDGVLTNDPAGARDAFDQMQRRSYA
jgi:glycerophosphoryl diester phosphodiesterase